MLQQFSRYYMEFLSELWSNFRGWFSQFFGLFTKIFYYDPRDYITLLIGYCFGEDWGVLDWVVLLVVSLINLAFIVLLIMLIYQLLRRYIRFHKKEVEKDMLIQEVDTLNQKVIDLIDEKNKILALRVSQIGGGSNVLNPNDMFKDESGRVVKKDKNGEVVEGVGRFIKLSEVDERYKLSPEFTVMEGTDMLDLPGLIDRFIKFSASQLNLYYKKEIIARYFAAMATSKVLILEGISGTGKTSLPYAMGKFFNKETSIISVQPSWRDRAELLGYLNEFTKKFNETDFLKAVYEANYSDKPNFIVLDEMNLARIEYYFAEFLSVMEMPDPAEWKIDLVSGTLEDDPKMLINGKLLICQNLWFIGTANKDDSTFTITDKVYDRATPIVINTKADYIDAPYTENVNMTFEYLEELFKRAQSEVSISQRSMENFRKLDEFIQKNFKIAFGNRIMKQIRAFVPVYMACGFSELQGLDYMLCNKILRKFESLNLTFLRNELDQLILLLDKLFGKGSFAVSIEYINDLKKLM